jgi:hypothetical protein
VNWSLNRNIKGAPRRAWHRDPAVLAQTLNRVPVAMGGILAVVAALGFLVWLGVPAVWDAWEHESWGVALWRVVESGLGMIFCALTGFLLGKALTSLFLRLALRLADSGAVKSLETKWESLRTQPTERRY